jgi:hypothetical protein
MDPTFFRKYADLITEAEQTPQLDEGVFDKIKQLAISKAQAAVKTLGKDKLEAITNLVASALGKPADQITMADFTIDNAKKILAADGHRGVSESGVTLTDDQLPPDYVPKTPKFPVLSFLGGFGMMAAWGAYDSGVTSGMGGLGDYTATYQSQLLLAGLAVIVAYLVVAIMDRK